MDYAERLQIMEDFAQTVRTAFPQMDKYNILIFGSF